MKKKFIRTMIFFALGLTAVAIGFFIDFFITQPPYEEKKLNYIDYSLEIFDKNARPVSFSLAESEASYTKLDTLPEYVKQAFILAEDKNFYSHGGIDYRRLVGAVVNNIFHPKKLQGASTITQQLIKNTHLDNSRTLKRKFHELNLAKALEKEHTKDEIFEIYLNTIYFGNKAYGIEKASRIYFNKSASELSPAEAATLAAVIKGPSVYAPNADINKCIARRNYILGLLHSHGTISEKEYQDAQNERIDIDKISEENLHKKAYEDAVVSEAAELLTINQAEVYQNGLKIYTYLDPTIQEKTEKIIYDKKHIKQNSQGKAADSAAIIIDNKTAGVSALVGRGRENLYTMRRQPGSCIKPALVYVPALEENLITPLTFLYDAKTEYGNYCPTNYMDRYYGWISVKRAVEMSLNSPAVALFQMTGIKKAKRIAELSGIKFHEKDDGLALGLGGFTYGVTMTELAGSYTTIANGGHYKPVRFIDKIVDKDGKTIYKNQAKPSTAMRSDTAYLMTDILAGVVKNGTATPLRALECAIAAKTGTVGLENSEENTDAWLMSYTSNHTVGIWYGSPGGKEQLLDKSLTGGSLATVAADVFGCLYTTKTLPPAFHRPDSVLCVNVDTLSLDRKKVELAALNTPEKYKQKAYFSVFNMPSKIADSPYNLIPMKIAG